MKHTFKFKIITTLALVFAVTTPVFAETQNGAGFGAEIKARAKALWSDTKEEREEIKSDVKAKIETMRVDVKAMIEAGATPEEIKAKIEEVRLSNQEDREAFRQDLEEKRKTFKDVIKSEIDSFKEGKKVRLSKEVKAEAKERLDTAFLKLDDVIARFSNFDKKLGGEIEKRKTLGLDVTEAEVAIELARRSLEETRVSIAAVNSAVNSSLNSETSASKEAIKTVMNTALESVKATKMKYAEVIKLLPKINTGAGVEVK